MRGTSPPPIVPEMSTDDEPTAGLERNSGDEHRSLPERAFGAPLVPDCS